MSENPHAVTVAQEPVVLEDEFYGLSERADMATSDDDADTYAVGLRDGYEQAVATIDMLTGGNGEYTFCTVPDDRHCPDPPTMIRRIMDRLASISPANAEETSEMIAQLDIDALASVIHDARWDQGSSASSWVPFNDETGTGKVYSLRIANAVQMHLLRLAADHIRDEPKLIQFVPATNQAGEVAADTAALNDLDTWAEQHCADHDEDYIAKDDVVRYAASLRAMLLKCRDQFAFYEQSHRAKGTADADAKALVNARMVTDINAALSCAKAGAAADGKEAVRG